MDDKKVFITGSHVWAAEQEQFQMSFFGIGKKSSGLKRDNRIELSNIHIDASLYTLVIPTYNRPALLDRLLSYLERQQPSFSILVLDSSPEPARSENRTRIEKSALNVRHLTFDTSIHPYLKMQAGLKEVTTPFVSACADDDFVVLAGVAECLNILQANPTAAAAHGWYFNWQDTGARFDLTYLVQRASAVAGEGPMERLRHFIQAYDVIFYALHRTDVMQEAFRFVGEMRSTLAGETLMGFSTVIQGPVLRVDSAYYGRNTNESVSIDAWHPHQIMADRPSRLFEDYPRLKQILIELCQKNGMKESAELASEILDLSFLSYIGPFLRKDVCNLIIEDKQAGKSSVDIARHIWQVFVLPGKRGINYQSSLYSPDGEIYLPAQFRKGESKKIDYHYDLPLPQGGSRHYVILFEFLFAEASPPPALDRKKLQWLMQTIALY